MLSSELPCKCFRYLPGLYFVRPKSPYDRNESTVPLTTFQTGMRNIAHTSLECGKRNCTFVPIVGGLGTDEVQSGQVAEAFARKFGGKHIPFFSPAVFSNERLMQEFLKEDSVNYIFDYFKKLNTVISGISG